MVFNNSHCVKLNEYKLKNLKFIPNFKKFHVLFKSSWPLMNREGAFIISRINTIIMEGVFLYFTETFKFLT
jgi:hypothetical protein